MEKRDIALLRNLGAKIAEIAALPVQSKKIGLWKKNNALRPSRPMVYVDQLPWHEISRSDEMKLECADSFAREIEYTIRQLLYRWDHFPVDMVVENRIDIPVSVRNLLYGYEVVEETIATDKENDIVSHRYFDRAGTEEELAALKPDELRVDRELDARRLDEAHAVFKDLIPVRLKGIQFHSGVWDRITRARSADKILWDLADRPEYSVKVVNRFVELSLNTLDQCEELGILDAMPQYIHCTGAYNDELPADGFDPARPRAKDCWSYGMAQIFSTVSPAMHEEYEIDLVAPLYNRFGLLYYGCCEPLHDKIDIIRKLKNVRKISVSPWADIDRAAEKIGKDYVFSFKPNPAFIADSFSLEAIKKQIVHVVEACSKNGCSVELILKDVSTVGNHLEYLDTWAKVVSELVA